MPNITPSEDRTVETVHVPNNPTLTGLARLTRNVAYRTGADDPVMDIIAPQSTGDDDDRRYPTVVFVQGSAWTTPDRDYEIPQLSELAREGFVVATVNHRNASRDASAVFPAYLKDVKAAIRYLRANAAALARRPERLGIWGTSSGGNTSLLVGLTADDPRYEDGSYATESDAVSFVVSCFPPTDMMEAIDAFGNEDDPFRLYYFGPFAAVVGATHETGLSDDVRRRAADMSRTCRCVTGWLSGRRCCLQRHRRPPWSPTGSRSRCTRGFSNTAWTRGWCWSTVQNTSTTSGARRCSI